MPKLEWKGEGCPRSASILLRCVGSPTRIQGRETTHCPRCSLFELLICLNSPPLPLGKSLIQVEESLSCCHAMCSGCCQPHLQRVGHLQNWRKVFLSCSPSESQEKSRPCLPRNCLLRKGRALSTLSGCQMSCKCQNAGGMQSPSLPSSKNRVPVLSFYAKNVHMR